MAGTSSTTEEAADYLDGLPWPAFVLDDIMQVVAANVVAQRLWGVDLTREFTGRSNETFCASPPRPASPTISSTGTNSSRPASPSSKDITLDREHRGAQPNFALVLTQLLAGEPKYANASSKSGARNGRSPKVRWNYPVVWRDNNAAS